MLITIINNYRLTKEQYFNWRIFDNVAKQLLHLLLSRMSVRYLNLVNARWSHVEQVSFTQICTGHQGRIKGRAMGAIAPGPRCKGSPW